MSAEHVDKPIEFLFGPHGRGQVEYLENFRSALERELERCPDRKVLAYVEGADMPEEIAELTFANSVKGQPPSIAIQNAVREFASTSFSSEEELTAWLESNGEDSTQPEDVKSYYEVEIELLDDVATRYPGRLLFAVEATPKEELERLKTLRIQAKNQKAKSTEFVLTGDFESALKYYKASVRLSTKERVERDQRVAEQLPSFIGREDVSAVIVKFGPFHTGIAYKLSREGNKVVWRFDDRTPGFDYIFDPKEALSRKIIFTNREPTEVEWYRSMLGNVYYLSSLVMDDLFRESREQEYTLQDFAEVATEFSIRIVGMQEVREFIELFEFMQKKYGAGPITFMSAAFKFEEGEQIPSGVNQVYKE